LPSGISKQLIRLGKDSFFYGMGSVLQKFIGFFLFPIYTRLLTQEEFGAQDLIFTAVTITTYFIVLGLDSGTARHYYDVETSIERRKILSTYLWFELLISIPTTLILILYAQPISEIIFKDGSLASFFILAIASLPFTLVSGITLLVLRLTFQSWKFSIVTATGVLVQATASIYLVVSLRMGIQGVFIANLIASAYRAAIGLILTYKNFTFTISKQWLKPMLMFGIPLVPASLSLWVLNYSNRYFLVRLATLSDIGLLGAATRISSIVVFVISAFRTAWGPFSYSLIKDEALAKATYSKTLTYFLLITLAATSSLSIFAREAVTILATASYLPSTFLIPYLAYSAIIWGAVYIVGMGYGIAKKSYHTTVATVLAAVGNVALNFLLIPPLGILGAAISTLAGNLITLIYSYLVAQRYFYVQYEYRRIIPLIIMSSLSIGTSMYIDNMATTWNLTSFLFKLLIFLTFIGSLFVFKLVGREEINWLRHFLRKQKRQLKS
jgi:O-antigen/teichoic acid export membrane protein